MIEQEEFPDSWAEGVSSSIHKSGPLLDPKNHRGITVLPIFEKVFEIIVQRRLEFINDAFLRKDCYNGGFLKGSQTADNLFILQSLIERQLALCQNLIVCFIDFSRALDLMNRNILFYMLIKSRLRGRVINTLRNLYTKTYFRVKQGGYLSDLIVQEVGVNQGGNASPIIFRKYLSDLRNYLNKKTGVILSEDEILVHLLWADDLIMTSTTTADAQNQLNGLSNYCSKHKSIVNSGNTKFMVYSRLGNVCVLTVKPWNKSQSINILGTLSDQLNARQMMYLQRITNTSVIKPIEASSHFLRRHKTLGPYHRKSGYTYLIVWLDLYLYMGYWSSWQGTDG